MTRPVAPSQCFPAVSGRYLSPHSLTRERSAASARFLHDFPLIQKQDHDHVRSAHEIRHLSSLLLLLYPSQLHADASEAVFGAHSGSARPSKRPVTLKRSRGWVGVGALLRGSFFEGTSFHHGLSPKAAPCKPTEVENLVTTMCSRIPLHAAVEPFQRTHFSAETKATTDASKLGALIGPSTDGGVPYLREVALETVDRPAKRPARSGRKQTASQLIIDTSHLWADRDPFCPQRLHLLFS